MARSSGVGKINRMLDGATNAAIVEVQPALLKAGDRMANTMRQLARPSRDSGDMINSIAVTPGGQSTPPYSQPGGATIVPANQVAITVGNSAVRYPHFVEYGTSKTQAQPFFWPAFRLERRKVLASIKRAISKAVRKGAKSGV